MPMLELGTQMNQILPIQKKYLWELKKENNTHYKL